MCIRRKGALYYYEMAISLIRKRRHFLRQWIDAVTALPYQVLMTVWIALVLFFATAYFVLGSTDVHGPAALHGMEPVRQFWNSLYFSVITATSTGYGDITPQGFSKLLAALQSVMSLFIFAVFVTKLVSRRQDIALQQIHKLTFEDAFHTIREGFYIVRNDFDELVAKAGTLHELKEEDWDVLTTAYRQAQSYLRRIPDFYDEHNRLYNIDIRREELLYEAVKRTLQRIHHLLEIFQTKHIAWKDHNASLEELREFIQLTEHIVRFWREQSPHHRMEEFEELLRANEEIRRKADVSSKR